MADEPANTPAKDPAKEPGKELAKTPKPKPEPRSRTHCPNCSAAALVHAKEHCHEKPACHWRICRCGYTWNRDTGAGYAAVKW